MSALLPGVSHSGWTWPPGFYSVYPSLPGRNPDPVPALLHSSKVTFWKVIKSVMSALWTEFLHGVKNLPSYSWICMQIGSDHWTLAALVSSIFLSPRVSSYQFWILSALLSTCIMLVVWPVLINLNLDAQTKHYSHPVPLQLPSSQEPA